MAVYAQFGPGKFPATYWIVLGCVVSYCLLTWALAMYCWKFEGDAVVLTKPKVRCPLNPPEKFEGDAFVLTKPKVRRHLNPPEKFEGDAFVLTKPKVRRRLNPPEDPPGRSSSRVKYRMLGLHRALTLFPNCTYLQPPDTLHIAQAEDIHPSLTLLPS